MLEEINTKIYATKDSTTTQNDIVPVDNNNSIVNENNDCDLDSENSGDSDESSGDSDEISSRNSDTIVCMNASHCFIFNNY